MTISQYLSNHYRWRAEIHYIVGIEIEKKSVDLEFITDLDTYTDLSNNSRRIKRIIIEPIRTAP